MREVRERRAPRYLQDYVAGNDLVTDDEEEEINVMEEVDQDPICFEEAVKNDKWKKAMNLEIETIERNNTWYLVDLPKDAKCIGVKWIFNTKLNENGEIEKHKARLVARRYGQEYGVDYMEVFEPVARMDTIRIMIAIASQRGWSSFQMDVKSAFLHGTLEENVYVQQPMGYVVKGSEDKVCKLDKSLYRLKQAPRAWFNRIDSYFVDQGFERSKAENTLFIKKGKNVKVLYVNIYVDDLVFTGDDEAMMEEFWCSMKRELEITDLGRMRYFLGIEVIQTAEENHIFHKGLMLKRYFTGLKCWNVMK